MVGEQSRWGWASFLLLISITACPSEPDPQLHIDLITDLVPNVEFDALRLEVGTGEFAFRSDHLAEPTVDYVRGTRLNSVMVAGADTEVLVRLVGPGGDVVAEKRSVVRLTAGSQTVTIVVSRDCRGVECPTSGNPSLDSCLGGRCVDPLCTPQTPEFCPAPACDGHSDCRAASCADPYCSSGVCFVVPVGPRCPNGEYCNGDFETGGCRPTPAGSDAGVHDAGADARLDAGAAPELPHIQFPWNGYTTGSPHPTDLVHPPLQPRFRWRAVGGASSYQFQLTRECEPAGFQDCTFLDEVRSETLTDPSFQPDRPLRVSRAVPVGSRYYWRVRACNSTDRCSSWTDVHYLDVGRQVSDFNGDGFADLAVGASRHDTPFANAGSVYVYLGSPLGLEPDPSTTLHAPPDTRGDRFGRTVAAVGDVNADGYADLLVGAWLTDAPSSDSGAVYLFLGRASGFAPHQRIDNPNDQVAAVFGSAIAGLGDVDSDGYADVGVGAPQQDVGEALRGGMAYVYRGQSTGLSPMISRSFMLEEAGANFGQSIASIGDVNADGRPDFAIGAGGRSAPANREGNVFVYYGRPGDVPELHGLVLDNPDNQADANFGQAISGGGDLNGDGHSDVVVGAYGHQDGLGIVYLFLGSTGDASVVPHAIFPNPSGATDSRFGQAVHVVGDMNNDGYADLAIGAFKQHIALDNEGAAYLYLGGDPVSPMPTTELMNPGLVRESLFGASLGGGDFNGDGRPSLVVGAPGQGATAHGVVKIYDGTDPAQDGERAQPDGQPDSHFGVFVTR